MKADYARWKQNFNSEAKPFWEALYVWRKCLQHSKQSNYLCYCSRKTAGEFLPVRLNGRHRNKSERWNVFGNLKDLNLAFLLTSCVGGGKLLVCFLQTLNHYLTKPPGGIVKINTRPKSILKMNKPILCLHSVTQLKRLLCRASLGGISECCFRLSV